jgi:OMF family outer membrane factor
VKGQYLFYSFLPSVTAAVLTTQPGLAGIATGVKLGSSPSVLTYSDSPTSVADNIDTQLPITKTQIFPDIVPESGLTTFDLQSSMSKSNPVILTKTTVIPIEEDSQKDEGKFPSFTHWLNPDPNNHQQQTEIASYEQQLQTTGNLNVTSKPNVYLSSLPSSATYATKAKTQSLNLKTEFQGNTAAGLLSVASCSQNGELNNISISSSTTASKCPSQHLSYPNTANITSALGNTGSDLILLPPETNNIAPASTAQIPTQIEGVRFMPTSSVEIPGHLIPSANPLQFPTKPEEVRLEGNQPITLVQALELAKRNNRDLQVSLLQLERAQAALGEAQAALLPNVGLSADITRSRSAAQQLQLEQQARQSPLPVPAAETTTAFSGQAQLTYDLFTSGRRRANIRQAEEQVRLNELAVEAQSEEIRLNVATEYYDLQQADERVRIAQSAVQNAQASLRDAQALERAGVGTRFDVLQSQVNLANSQQELTNAFSQQQVARRRLSTRLSLPQSVNISAADPVQLAGLWSQDLDSSIILAFQNRPELQQQLAQRNISEQQRRQALSALGPQVSLIASYNLLDQFDDGVSVTDGYSVGVRATLNLYDGGAAKASAAQAKANVAIAETEFSEQRNQIRFQVEQAFSTQKANLENVQTANTALEQAREALRLARLRFQAGVGTQTDVINSENDLTRAEGNRITAILDYNRALAQLQRAVTSRGLAQ